MNSFIEKFMKLGKLEIQTEMIACTHIVVMAFVYAMLQYIMNGGSITFWQLVEMSALGYGVAWGQQLIFWGERVYSRTSYTIRSICWIVLPAILTVIFGILFCWFPDQPRTVEWGFYIFQLIYYGFFWFFLQVFFKKETRDLNEWLADYKKED